MIEHINEWITKDKIVSPEATLTPLYQHVGPDITFCLQPGYFSTFVRGKSAYMDLQDLMLVVGTSAQVYPAAGYISRAKLHGARIVTVNPEAEDETELYKIQPGDFAFGQDAAEYLPKLLEPVIGKLQENGEFENRD